MRVCYFGSYDPTYPRNRILLKGMIRNDIDTIECNAPLRRSFKPSSRYRNFLSRIGLGSKSLPIKYLSLIKKHAVCNYDVMLVGYLAHPVFPLAKMISRKPKVIDIFYSLYDTLVFDRKIFDQGSFKSKILYYLDKLACDSSDIILLDTNQHIEYFSKTFGIERKKFKRIFVGSDDEVFYPRGAKKKKTDFSVLFVGSFIPLQGIEYIIRSAKILEKENIIFEIIGIGQTYNEMKKLCKELNCMNVKFLGWQDYESLPIYYSKADLCLGIFGNTSKAKRVIPNKVFDGLAMGKPIVTGDSPAAREAFIDGRHCILCEMANPEALADSILKLKEDGELRDKIAKNGYSLFKERFCPKVIGKELNVHLQELVK